MRLMDADSLLMNMDKGMQGTAREYLKFYQMAINDEPTAYDLDKVAEQLWSESERWRKSGEEYEDEKELGVADGLKRAIEIVKSGGIE